MNEMKKNIAKSTIKQGGLTLDLVIKINLFTKRYRTKIFYEGKLLSRDSRKLTSEILDTFNDMKKGATYFENLCGGADYLAYGDFHSDIYTFQILPSPFHLEDKIKKILLNKKIKEKF